MKLDEHTFYKTSGSQFNKKKKKKKTEYCRIILNRKR